MKTNTKLLIGLGVAAAATTAIAYGIYRELKAIRNLTINIEDLPEEDDLFEEIEEEEELEDAPVAEEAAEEVVAD